MLGACSSIALALAADTSDRLGLTRGAYPQYLARLDESAASAVQFRRRCTASWQTDTSTLMVLRELRGHELSPAVLASIALFVSVVPNGLLFERMALLELSAATGAEEGEVAREFLARFHRASPGGSSPMPPYLATGMKTALRPFGGRSLLEQAASYAEHVVRRGHVAFETLRQHLSSATGDDVAEASATGDEAAHASAAGGVGQLMSDLGAAFSLPLLRCVMLMRLLSLLEPRAYDWSRLDIGAGALTGFYEICQGRVRRRALAGVAPDICVRLRSEMLSNDELGVLKELERSGVRVLSATNLEHLVCEGRKAMHPERRLSGGPRTQDCLYRQLFDEVAEVYYQLLPAGIGESPAPGGVDEQGDFEDLQAQAAQDREGQPEEAEAPEDAPEGAPEEAQTEPEFFSSPQRRPPATSKRKGWPLAQGRPLATSPQGRPLATSPKGRLLATSPLATSLTPERQQSEFWLKEWPRLPRGASAEAKARHKELHLAWRGLVNQRRYQESLDTAAARAKVSDIGQQMRVVLREGEANCAGAVARILQGTQVVIGERLDDIVSHARHIVAAGQEAHESLGEQAEAEQPVTRHSAGTLPCAWAGVGVSFCGSCVSQAVNLLTGTRRSS